jgi:transmembrane sensor
MNESAEERRRRAAGDAARWTQRLDDGALTAAERSELTDWLRESPLHVSEMLACRRLSSALQGFSGWADLAPTDEPSAEREIPAHLASILSLRISGIGTRGVMRRNRRFRLRPTPRWLAGISAVAMIALASTWLLRTEVGSIVLHTQAGERREVTLEDGSVVQLLSNTELRVHMQPHQRTVQVERGEALFHVAKDPTRPFLVDVDTTRVRAVGTIFSVERRTDAVVVTVQEGKVEVKPRGADNREQTGSAAVAVVPLVANERLVVSALGVASAVRHIDLAPDAAPDDRFQWSDRPLSFENAKVADVVAQFNRRNTIQIRVVDPRLAARTVSGVFDGQDPQSFVDFLRSIGGATTRRGPDEVIVGLDAAPMSPSSRQP